MDGNNNNPIKYSDLVKPDNSITELIKQLDELGIAYSKTLKDVKTEAIQLKVSLQQVSGATAGNRDAIKKAAGETDRLARAEKELAFAESERAKEVAILKKATAEANEMNKLAIRLNDSMEGSYNRLSAQYSINKIALNNMSGEMRRTTKEGMALEKETKAIYEEMKRLQSDSGMNQLNVGNYPEVTEAISGYGDKLKETLGLNNEFGSSLLKLGQGGDEAKGMFTAMGDGAKALGKTLLGLLANPVFLAIAGIAAAGAAFKFWFDYNKGLVEATRLTGQFTGKSGNDLKQYRNEVQALADTFGKDFKDVLEGANAISKQFGIEQSEALKLVKDGFIAGADANGQYLENIKEYPAYFKEAGVSASQFIAITTAGAKAGIYSDKSVDVIKEGNIRIREMTKATASALQGIGINYVDIQKKLQDGSMTTFDVMQQVSQKLSELPESSAAVGTAIADIFGDPGEDAGLQYLTTLKDIDTNLDSVKENAGELGKLQEEQINSQAELNNMISALFDKTGGSFESMTTQAKIFVNDALIWIIKNVIDLSNYFIKLYNDSIVFRGAVQAIGIAFSNIFTSAKALFTFVMDSLQTVGQALHGAFTLNWDEVKGAYIRWGNNMKKFATSVISGVQSNVQNGINNMNKKVTPITIPVVTSDKTENFDMKLMAGGSGPVDYTKKTKTKKVKDPAIALEKAYKTNLELKRKYEDAELTLEKDEFEKRRKQTELNYSRQIEDAKHQLETDKTLNKQGREALNMLILSAESQLTDDLLKIEQERQIAVLNLEKQGLELRLAGVRKGTEQERLLRLELLENERKIALAQNKALPVTQQQSEIDINAKYDTNASGIADEYLQAQLKMFDAQQNLAQSEFDLLRNSEGRKTRFRLEAEKARLNKILELNKLAGNKMSTTEIETIKNTVAKIDQEISESKGEEGSKDIYGLLGINLDDKAKAAISESTSFALGQIQSVLDGRVAAAEKAVEVADKEVDSAKSKLDAEIEARNNGYANNVIVAQKELDQAKKNQEKANKDKAKAVKQQQMLDTITQSSSLLTASANIWSSLSTIPIIGPALAIAAITTMWGSFALAKIKAKQATQSSAPTESYGDGTVELLQGGSHQSGNDVDLGTKANGTRRRAEGGEYFSVINKRSSRKFRSLIPNVIKSLNDGSFKDKYMNAFSGDGLSINLQSGNSPDMTELNSNVREIRDQNKRRYYTDGSGRTIETYKNLKRIHKN